MKEDYNFGADIVRFNGMYSLSRPDIPTLLPVRRLSDFRSIIGEEIKEGEEIAFSRPEIVNRENALDFLTNLSDWHGDIAVYLWSEAKRWGLPFPGFDGHIEKKRLFLDGLPTGDEIRETVRRLGQTLSHIDSVEGLYSNFLKLGNDLSEGQQREVLNGVGSVLNALNRVNYEYAMRIGLPFMGALEIIMQSNFSKLGADGKPIYDERGKVQKGPNYWKPEPKIRDLLNSRLSAGTRKCCNGYS